MTQTAWSAIAGAMRTGGFHDRIMAAGSELDRVKSYLLAFEEEPVPARASPSMKPTYPCFPGLRHKPFHDASAFAATAILERAYPAIRDEAAALAEGAQLDYTIASKPMRSLRRPWTYLKRSAPPRAWTVYPFWHMGVDVEAMTGRCPDTMATLALLPDLCVQYPWGDALFSVQAAQSRLPPHCSIDNLRVRCHLGLQIPPKTGIRVATETRGWTEGKCLFFEDAFEHEVWNESAHRRTVLIVDLWHPDLTAVERAALTAGFLKREVRQLFLAQRISMTDAPGTYLPFLEHAVLTQEDSPLVRQYWGGA